MSGLAQCIDMCTEPVGGVPVRQKMFDLKEAIVPIALRLQSDRDTQSREPTSYGVVLDRRGACTVAVGGML